MEDLTYFEALTYIQSGISIFKDGEEMTERKINDLFFDFMDNDNKTIEFKIS